MIDYTPAEQAIRAALALPAATGTGNPPAWHDGGTKCSHPHNLPYNDECAVWWLRGTPTWRLAHTNLHPDAQPEGRTGHAD